MDLSSYLKTVVQDSLRHASAVLVCVGGMGWRGGVEVGVGVEGGRK